MPQHFGLVNIAQIIGGIALFLFGLSLISDSLKRYAGMHLKLLLGLLTRNRWLAILAGVLIAAILQSGSVATSLLAELTGSGLINLPQALAVTLGAGIGSSLTVQIIAFRIANYALLPFAIGVVLRFVTRRGELQATAAVLMGFGLIFLGMTVMQLGFEPLKGSPRFVAALQHLASTPLLGILGAAALTALIQASAATVAIAMSLSAAGLLPLQGAVAIVLGANVGVCATAFLPAIHVGRKGLQVALGNLALKLAGVILFSFFFHWAVVLAGKMWDEPTRQIANFHTFFNIAIAVVLAPFVYLLARCLSGLLPPRQDRNRVAHQVDLKVISPPEEALRRAQEDVLQVARRAAELVDAVDDLIGTTSRHAAEQVAEQDDAIDAAVEILTIYLARIGQQPLNPSLMEKRQLLLGVLRSVERIGDLVSKELAPAALQRIEKGAFFSIEGSRQLRQWHREVGNALHYAVEGLRSGRDRASQPLDSAPVKSDEAEAWARRLYQDHYARVRDGVLAASTTTTQFTDAVAALREIHFQASEIARLAARLNG